MHILTLRLSLFGDYKRYTPTTENSIQWTQALQKAGYEFLPNIIQVQQPTPQGAAEKRMQFVAPTGDICVRILAERIDVEFARGVSDQMDRCFADRLAMGVKIMSVMQAALGGVKGQRLAYYVDAFIPEQEKPMLQRFYQDNNLGITLHGAHDECIEWNHRFNRRTPIDISGTSEECNVIFALESGVMQAIHTAAREHLTYRGVRVTADINTLAENGEKRFGAAQAESFFASADALYHDAMQQLEEKMA